VRRYQKPQKAFTLVELIVVIVVLGILATIAILGYRAVVNQTNQRTIEEAARSLDRQITTMASFGHSTDLTSVNPRNSNLLLDLLRGSFDTSIKVEDIPNSDIMAADLKSSNLRVLIWNHDSTALSSPASWTRLCSDGPSVACVATSSNLQGTDLGDLPAYDDTALVLDPTQLCFAIHKNDTTTYLGLSDSAIKKGAVHNDITIACADAIAFLTHDPVEATKDYYDLGKSDTPANDPSWAKGD
jgi:prepilin-type N-terminal cleavage/methylation domain-containing protein